MGGASEQGCIIKRFIEQSASIRHSRMNSSESEEHLYESEEQEREKLYVATVCDEGIPLPNICDGDEEGIFKSPQPNQTHQEACNGNVST